MEFRYPDFDGVSPPRYFPTSRRISFASFDPPPPYHDSYFLPSGADYEPYDYRYFSSRERMLDYRRRSEDPPSGYNLLGPRRPCRDLFLDREYEKEKIREEILREEVYRRFIEEEVRRRIIKEEVRRELEMEYYYGLRYPNLGYPAWSTVQFERPGFSHACYRKGPRGRAPRNRFKGKRCIKNVQHKIVEINEDELMAKLPVSGEKVQLSNEEEIQKKKDKVAIQTEENGNKVEGNVSAISQKIVEVTEEEIRPPQTLLDDSMQSSENQEQVRPKASLLTEALPKGKIKTPSNRNNIEKEGNGNKVLEPENEQLAFSQPSKELNKEAEACGSKRKGDFFLALSTPATTGGGTDKMGSKKAKKQKIERKKYICTLCQATIYNDHDWSCHLKGNRHRNTLKRLEINKASFDVDNKRTSGIGLAAVKLEMENGDSPAREPTGKSLQTDTGLIKKIQVGHEVHEVVEKNNRLWCEKCQYNCTTTVMMTIHLVSGEHRRNCWKQ